jgi:hypothetical protein
MPIAHGDETFRIAAGGKGALECARLPFGEKANRRAAADCGVMIGNGASAAVRDPPGERFARKPCAGEINDVGIAEKIVEEWLDGSGRVGAAQLKQNYADALALAHAEKRRLLQAAFQALDFVLKPREAAAHGDLIDEEYGPDRHESFKHAI